VLLLVVVVFTTPAVNYAQEAVAVDWPMLGHDAAHTSAVSSDIEPPLVKRSIFNLTRGQFVSSPIVIGDSLFAFVDVGGLSIDVHVFSLDRESGAVRWRYDTGGALFAWPAASDRFIFVPVTYRGPPPLANGTQPYNQTLGGGALIVLDETNGRLVWSKHTVDTIMTSPVVEAGTVYATFDKEGAYALDAATGSVKWFYPLLTSNLMLAPPIEYNGTVIVPAYAQGVIALDARNGGLKWKYDVASHFGFHSGAEGESTAGAGMIFAPFYDFSDDQRSRYRVTLVAFNPDNGKVVWQTLLQDLAFEGGLAGSTYLAFANNTVYATGPYHHLNGTVPGNGPVMALDALTGAVKWSTSIPRPNSRIAVAGNTLLVGSYLNRTEISALDVSTGLQVWHYKPYCAAYYKCEFVVGDGVLYVATDGYSMLSSLSSATAVPEIRAPATIFVTSLITLVAFRAHWRRAGSEEMSTELGASFGQTDCADNSV
jgi:outer membrane protein assembly factor BamB